MRMLLLVIVAYVLVFCGGCLAIKKAFVATHDAIDEAGGIEAITDKVTPTPATSNEIKPDPAVKYNGGNEAADGGFQYEIWIANWHGMNIRVHANPGEGRIAGIPIAGKWYPLNMSIMPKDIVTMTRTATGATFTAKDFTALSGQKYRIEAMKADGLGTVDKVRKLDLPENKFGGAVIIWYATVE